MTRHLFQCIADHRYSAIGRHLRDAHGNIDLLNESQFRMLKICSTKWDCLVYEMLYIRTIRPNLNTQRDSLFKFQCFLIYSSLHYIWSLLLLYFHMIMTFWKHRNIWTIMEIEYITWKILPRHDNFNKERIFITIQFCEFGLHLLWVVRSCLVFLHSSKLIITNIF